MICDMIYCDGLEDVLVNFVKADVSESFIMDVLYNMPITNF